MRVRFSRRMRILCVIIPTELLGTTTRSPRKGLSFNLNRSCRIVLTFLKSLCTHLNLV